MNSTEERLNHIAKVARARDEQIKLEAGIKFLTCKQLIDQIECKSREVFPDLFKVASALVSWGYYLGNKPHWADPPEFCTDGITHRMGFFIKGNNPIVGAKGAQPVAFGYMGGGWNGVDFKVNVDGKMMSYDCNHVWHEKLMESYCSDLDDFCKRFYAWVDSLK